MTSSKKAMRGKCVDRWTCEKAGHSNLSTWGRFASTYPRGNNTFDGRLALSLKTAFIWF